MKTIAILLAALTSYLLPDGQVVTTDDAARQAWCRSKGGVAVQQVTVTTTNIVPADAAAQKRYAWAWWLYQKCIAYGATSDETLDNIANMTAWVQHTDLTEAQARGIQADGSAMIAVKAELAQFGGWRACLTITGQAQTNITTETRWVPVQ
jgi:hypothetical protein